MFSLSGVTGKVKGLKEHFFPPVTAWRFTKIDSSHKKMNEYTEKY